MNLSPSRRNFLKLLSQLCGGAVISSVLSVPILASDIVSDFKNITSSQTEKLLLMTRAIFPHNKIDNEPYWAVVKQFDAMCADAGFKALITSGIDELDKAAERNWVDVSAKAKVKALKAIQAGAFFQTIRILTLINLYSNPETFKTFGYQGSSFEQGGYLHRGFNDLNWLPEPAS